MRKVITKARHDFSVAMDDDLNVSKALAALFDFVREINGRLSLRAAGGSASAYQNALGLINVVDQVLGLGISERKKTAVPAEVMTLMQNREIAREQKDWSKADALRKELAGLGYQVEDSQDGPRLKPL